MIKDILTDEMVETNLSFKEWREAARAAGKILVRNHKVSSAFVDSMISTLEKYGPYMILLPKVCLFHGEPGMDVKEPCLSLCVLKEPIYFKEYENQEIDCAFAFGATDRVSHMNMIKDLASLLQDQEFIRLITTNGNKSAIMDRIQKY